MIRVILSVLLACAAACSWAAVPIASISPHSQQGMTMTNVGDGEYTIENIAGRDCWVNKKGSHFLYFAFNDDIKNKISPNAYIAIDVICTGRTVGFLGVNHSTENDFYGRGKGFAVLGDGKWVTSLAQLQDFVPRLGMNYGCYMRFDLMSEMYVSKVEVYNEMPTDIDITDPSASLEKALGTKAPAKGMTYVFGNNASEAQAILFRSLGVSSVESYVTWYSVENTKGEWNWKEWDNQVDVLLKYGLKWVPFIIVGPAYSTPDWFRASSEHVPCQCLEHGTDSKIESLWNPYLKKYIRRYLEAFAERYVKTGVIESVLLGIQGDFGEAIYSVSGGGWTFNIPGEYHNHMGFWCGDKYARADFREYVIKKYKTLSVINTEWNTDYKSLDEIDYPFNTEAEKAVYTAGLKTKPETRRHYLDFVAWYRSSMTDLADWWMKTTREIFPDTDIYLCTGGHSAAELGGHFADQCRVAARYNAGVRITNETSDYASNLTVTRWVASAGKHYGAKFAFEPAGTEDYYGIVARIYNATASGADQLHDYCTNVTGKQETIDQQKRNFKYLFHTKPIVPVALWYPDTNLVLEWGDFLTRAAALRDYFDYDFVDESMALNGALKHNKILVIANGDILETQVAGRLAAWARNGGRIIVVDVPAFQDVNGTAAPEKLLFPNGPKGGSYGKGYIYRVDNYAQLADKITDILWKLGYPVYEIKDNGLYVTQIEPERLLVYSKNDKPTELVVNYKKEKKTFVCNGKEITDIKL